MDVVAGRVIDRTVTRWGRFRPFILWGTLPLMLLSIAVFSVPSEWDAGAKLCYAYVTYALLGTAYAFVNIAYGSLATALTQTPRDRARLGVSRTVAATCTFVFLTVVAGPSIASIKGALLQTWLTRFTLALAIAGLLLHLICFKTATEVVRREIKEPKLKESLRTLICNRPLLMLCAGGLCVALGQTSSGASMVFFARYVVGDAKQFFATIALLTLGSTLIATFLVPRLVGRFGKKNAYLVGLAVATIGYTTLFVVSENGMGWIFLPFGLAFLGTTIAMSIMWALEADTVEYGEWRTGLRIEGLTYSFFSLSRKFGQSLGGSIPAFLLAAGNYIPNATIQDANAVIGIRQAVALVPCLTFACAFAIMLRYPLTDTRFAELIADIRKRRQAQEN